MVDSKTGNNKTKDTLTHSAGAMELLTVIGFSFYFAWMLVCFFLLFETFLPETRAADRDVIQAFVFVGMPVGYIVLHLLGRRPTFRPFNIGNIITYAVTSLLVPAAALLTYFEVPVPMPVLFAVNFAAGMASAVLVTCWLDVLGRLNSSSNLRVVSLSLLLGCLLLLLVFILPLVFQPILAAIYALASCYLLKFASLRAPGNDRAPDASKVKSTWSFTLEIEPSIFTFGVVFALTFLFLVNSGLTVLVIGLSFVLLGAGAMVLYASRDKDMDITVLQRVLLCVTVLACLVVPFAELPVQVVCSGLVVASWAVFIATNYSLLVNKAHESNSDTPAFRQLPLRLFFAAAGFMVGWIIATAVTVVAGAHAEAFMVVRLCMAFVLVAVVMLFFPVRDHHDGTVDKPTEQAVVSSDMSEKELFEKRCNRISKMYALSPREADIMQYLARGRNAGYIQNQLTISPHTVKSHIYNIYRKLDIHSQQKLMDFVESYPLDEDDLNREK